MKKVILLFVLLPYLASGQVSDNFESGLSGNWVQSSQGRWSADTASALSGNYSLYHSFDNPEAGSDMIAIPVVNLHPDEGVVSWSFVLRHGYDPSSSNYWSVFLFSDTGPASLSADEKTNGFAVGVNLTGYDDTLRLWKIKGAVVTNVVTSGINWQTGVGMNDAVKITVERSADGKWLLSVCRLYGDTICTSYGCDKELFESSWFGIYYKYSSSRDRLLWIDDINIEGVFYADTLPPVITYCRVSGRSSLEITVNEDPGSSFSNIDNFHLNSEGNRPLTVVRKGDLNFGLQFAGEFINKATNNLFIRKICDEAGNESRDTVLGFIPVWAERGDLILSEIMADPLPSVSLPGKEYIEITNRTDFPFNLENWKLSSGDQTVYFPHLIIGPSEVQILCSAEDTLLFREFGKTSGLKQFPALTDDGKLICLRDTTSILIHGVEYSSKWYGSELKSQGGWSLEMIDNSFPFYYDGNWTASVSRKGGTPGILNSVSGVNKDVCFYGIKNVFPEDDTSIICRFSEPSGDLNNIRKGIIESGPGIADVFVSDLLFREFRIQLSAPLIQKNSYKIEFPDDLKDFAGNKIDNSSFLFGLTEAASEGDILFNELLFNPLPGDPDYIEFYNCSGKIIDASRLHIVYVNELTSDTSVLTAVSREKRCIMPESYFAVTSDREKIIERYASSVPENLFWIPSLPSMPDDDGTLILFNSELDLIDKVSYSEKMHYPLLSGFEGIALEKTGRCSLSGEAANWHSATEISGWGTPGGSNSVFVEISGHADKVILSSTKITPDNDGYEDFLTVSISLTGNGNTVSLSVFGEAGGFVRNIATNMLTGTETKFIWDGTADDGSPVNSGIYIILINLFDDKGKTERWKKICTVLR
jgi:hypothetical protein